MGESALREMLVSFGVEVDDHELEAFEHGLGGLVEKAQHVGRLVTGYLAFGEVKEFFEGTIEKVAQLGDTAERLGVGVEELQKFQYAAKLVGVEGEAAAHSLMLLNRNIGEAMSGGGAGAQEFRKLGVAFKDANGQARPTLDVVEDLADAFQDMPSAQERTAAAMKLFGRAGMSMAPLLAQGREEMHKTFEELQGLGGLMSEDFVKQAHDVDDQMVRMRVAFNGVKVHVVSALLPAIRGMTDWFTRFGKSIHDILDNTHAIEHLFTILKAAGVVKALMMIHGVLKKIAVGEGLIDALNPFTLMVVGATALFFILDDLMTMMEGGKSVIGDALGPDKAQMVDQLRDSFNQIKAAWNEMEPAIKSLGGSLLDAAKNILPVFAEVLAGIVKDADALLKILNSVGGAIGGWVGKKLFGENGKTDETVSMTPEAQKQWNELMVQTHGQNMLNPTPSMVTAPSPFAQQAQQIDSSVKINTLKVEVQHTGNEDPKQLAGNIATGTRDQLAKVLVDTNNAMKRK